MEFLPSKAFHQFPQDSGIVRVFTFCINFLIILFVVLLLPVWFRWSGFSNISLEEKLMLTAFIGFVALVLQFIKKAVFGRNQIIVDDNGFYLMSKGYERMRILKNDVWFFVIYPASMGIMNLSFEKEHPHFTETHFTSLLSDLKKDKNLGIAIKARNPEMNRRLSPPRDVKGEMAYYIQSLWGMVSKEEKEKAIAMSSNVQPNFIYFDLREGMLEWLAAHYPGVQVMVYKRSLKKVG